MNYEQFFRVTCLLFFAASLIATSFASPAAEEKPPLEIEDVIGRETISGARISPGAVFAAWVSTTADDRLNRRRRKIVVREIDGERKFTLDTPDTDSYSIRFAPDGSALFFLRSEEKGKAQIYKCSMSGGDSRKITSHPTGINDFRMLPGKMIVYSAREDSTYRERSLKRSKDNTVVVADQEHYPPVRLFLLDPDSGKTVRLTRNRGRITEFAPSPDGRMIAYNLNVDINYRYDHRNHPEQFILKLDLSEGAEPAGLPLEIFTEPDLNPRGYRWSSDSKGFYCAREIATDSTDTYVSIRKLYYYSVDSGRLEKVQIEDGMGLGGGYFPVDGGIVAGIADGVRYRNIFARARGGGYREYPLESEENMPMIVQAAREEDILFLVSDGSSVPVLKYSEIRGGKLRAEKALHTVDPGYRKKFLARSEVITWKGALDDPVDGILYYPRGYNEGERYPLMVSIHGGPSGYDMDFFSERWSNYPHTLAGKGFFVLKVNYHGSGNYGLEWIESIKGHYYEYEVPDILSGVQSLIERGLADPENIGIMGWSNGSILAIACCLESDIFKSLCAGAGDVNWTSDYGNCRFGAGFDNAYFGGPPWEIPEVYLEKSPLFRMEELETPTLIMFGGEDRSVPTEQGWQHFRAMQQIGRAPVRFILFPGAGHGPHKLSHQRRKMREELAWIDRYLLESPPDTSEVLSRRSPLYLEVQKLKAARRERLFGIEKNGILAPETVAYGELRPGRFEVTNAQFREFDNGYEYNDGDGNFPASGISFDDAQEYCRWLSGKTGAYYRLPSEKEMKKLIEAASPHRTGENNLAYWAGYEPTPDEQAALLEEIGQLDDTVSLLKEAGSFLPAAGKFYDLAGNLSEWVTTSKGQGKPFGLNALSNPDSRCNRAEPPAEYTGFRVFEDTR